VAIERALILEFEATLVASLKFLEDGHGTYLGADPILRRQINQALFKRIRIERNGGVRADLTEPFSSLLSPAIRDLVATRVGDEALQWRAWEDSINDNTHGDLPVGVGLTYESLVVPTGQHTNLPPLVEGPAIRLASCHAKVRREGYRRRQMY
jgi:hypothetical protein